MSNSGSQEDGQWPDFVPPDLGESINDAPKEPLLDGLPAAGPAGRPAGWHASGNPRWGSVTNTPTPDPSAWQPPTRPARRPDPERWFNQPVTSVPRRQPVEARFTVGMILACLVIWVGQILWPQLTSWLMMVPAAVPSQPWRLLTAALVHVPSSLTHVGFNMLTLWLMGRYLEPLMRTGRFAALYILSALGGSVMQMLLAGSSGWYAGSVGASGAIFGLFGAYMVISWLTGRSLTSMWALLGINLVVTLLSPGISWQGHLGGLVTGAATAAAMLAPGVRGAGTRATTWTRAGLAGVVALLAAGVALALALH